MSEIDDQRIAASSDLRVEMMRPATAGTVRPMTGVDLIAAERRRQVTVEGYTAEHDAGHAADLAEAGSAYAFEAHLMIAYPGQPENEPTCWPWADEFWKPTGDPVRDLTKAGALIAAALDALLSAPKSSGSES